MMKQIVLVLLLIIPFAVAQEKDMKLLAVSEGPDRELSGSIASLHVQITPGKGRVFIDSFPLTKLDTQLSTRFAKQMACDYTELDCAKLDFFYTIRSPSSIIGGPSAGAAITILTIGALLDLDVDPTVSISGTINSGGLVGPVGGLQQKIKVGGEFGLKTIMVPKGERYIDVDNHSVDLVNGGKDIGVSVIEVATIEEAMFHMYGIPPKKNVRDIKIAEDYDRIMEMLAKDLCERASTIRKDVVILTIKNETTLDKGDELYGKGVDTQEEDLFYSSASYCFGAGLEYRTILVEQELEEQGAGDLLFSRVRGKLAGAEKAMDGYQPETITDLQTLMIVKERLIEAKDYLKEASDSRDANESFARELAYAEERIASAESWSHFFGLDGQPFSLDTQRLQASCMEKIAEAQERINYVQLFVPLPLENTQRGIAHAETDRKNGDYVLCLFKASKAKAEANVIMTAIGFGEEELNASLARKLNLTQEVIVRQGDKGMFPILGYSYYEYAKSLQHTDRSSSLIYAEYALELSNLDIYFGTDETTIERLPLDASHLWVFLTGIAFGMILGLLLFSPKRKNKKKTSKK